MTLQRAARGHTGPNLRDLLGRPDVVEDRICRDLRYVVIAAPDGTHRLVVPADDAAGPYCCTIEPDAWAGLRLGATARLFVHLGFTAQRSGTELNPTPFQHRRLTLLLAILDRLDSARGPRATLREVAGELVYRNMSAQSAAAWKASTQRRQTQRLIAQARALRDGGYRALLLGNILKSRE